MIFYNQSIKSNLQLSVIDIMCKYGNKHCIDKANEYYNQWIRNYKLRNM